MNTCTTPGHEDRRRPEHQWICGGCVNALEQDLSSVSALWADLTITLTRQDTIGGDGGRRSAEVALIFKEGASEARWVLANVVGTWARLLAEHLGLQAPLNPARWLALNATSLAMHPAAGEAVEEIRDAVSQSYRVIDRPPEMLFAGSCPVADCPGVLWARPGDTHVACRDCSEVFEVAERREWMVEAAAVLRVTQQTALTWVRLLMDKEVPYRTWQSWRTRGRLHVQDLSPSGQPLYLFGHVSDLALQWVARGKVA